MKRTTPCPQVKGWVQKLLIKMIQDCETQVKGLGWLEKVGLRWVQKTYGRFGGEEKVGLSFENLRRRARGEEIAVRSASVGSSDSFAYEDRYLLGPDHSKKLKHPKCRALHARDRSPPSGAFNFGPEDGRTFDHPDSALSGAAQSMAESGKGGLLGPSDFAEKRGKQPSPAAGTVSYSPASSSGIK